jgi:hypothetical protein
MRYLGDALVILAAAGWLYGAYVMARSKTRIDAVQWAIGLRLGSHAFVGLNDDAHR